MSKLIHGRSKRFGGQNGATVYSIYRYGRSPRPYLCSTGGVDQVFGKTFVTGGERWGVEEQESPVVAVFPTYGSYQSESVGSYMILFVHPISRKKRYADWHNPLSMCDIEDLQIMFEGSRTRR